MTIFGYKVETARYSRKQQDDTFVPYFGISTWTFNNPNYAKRAPGAMRRKRIIVGRNKGFYIHVWLFSYRFDLDFHKYEAQK